jgi:hypothetical protein
VPSGGADGCSLISDVTCPAELDRFQGLKNSLACGKPTPRLSTVVRHLCAA